MQNNSIGIEGCDRGRCPHTQQLRGLARTAVIRTSLSPGCVDQTSRKAQTSTDSVLERPASVMVQYPSTCQPPSLYDKFKTTLFGAAQLQQYVHVCPLVRSISSVDKPLWVLTAGIITGNLPTRTYEPLWFLRRVATRNLRFVQFWYSPGGCTFERGLPFSDMELGFRLTDAFQV